MVEEKSDQVQAMTVSSSMSPKIKKNRAIEESSNASYENLKYPKTVNFVRLNSLEGKYALKRTLYG